MLHCIHFREVRGQISEALQVIVIESTLLEYSACIQFGAIPHGQVGYSQE